MNLKKPTQKEKIEKYEALLHALHLNSQVACNTKNVSQLLSNISDWSYAHRVGNGMLSETQQQKIVTKAFHKLTDLNK